MPLRVHYYSSLKVLNTHAEDAVTGEAFDLGSSVETSLWTKGSLMKSILNG